MQVLHLQVLDLKHAHMQFGIQALEALLQYKIVLEANALETSLHVIILLLRCVHAIVHRQLAHAVAVALHHLITHITPRKSASVLQHKIIPRLRSLSLHLLQARQEHIVRVLFRAQTVLTHVSGAFLMPYRDLATPITATSTYQIGRASCRERV